MKPQPLGPRGGKPRGLPPITAAEKRALVEHLQLMIDMAESALVKLRKLPLVQRTEWVQSQIDYYNYARRGFKWALGYAQRRRLKG